MIKDTGRSLNLSLIASLSCMKVRNAVMRTVIMIQIIAKDIRRELLSYPSRGYSCRIRRRVMGRRRRKV